MPQTTDHRKLTHLKPFRYELAGRWWCGMNRCAEGVSHVAIDMHLSRICSDLVLYILFNLIMES